MLSADERNATLQSVILTAVDAGTKKLRCACPGIVQGFDAATQTVSVKLAIKEILKIDGNETEVEIPMLVDVPVVMPRAGGFCLLMVPQSGDECLVIFSDMCIDSWYQSGGIQSQAERRRHDLSDGFAILGCWSQVHKPTFPAKGLRLQNDAGTAYLEIDEDGIRFQNADLGLRDIYMKDYGVAVGQQSSGTEQEPKFEVAPNHTAHFYGDAQFAQGKTATFNGMATFNGNIDLSGVDTGWQSVTLSNSAEVQDCPVRVRKIMDFVNVRGAITLDVDLVSGSGGAAQGVRTIATLGDVFKPTWPMQFPVTVDKTSGGYLILKLGTDGVLTLYNRSGNVVTSAHEIPLDFCYLRA